MPNGLPSKSIELKELLFGRFLPLSPECLTQLSAKAGLNGNRFLSFKIAVDLAHMETSSAVRLFFVYSKVV